MKNRNRIIFSFILALPIHALAVNTPIKGTWQTQKQDGRDVRIEIADCVSDHSLLCGKIVWLQQPVYGADDPEAGRPKHDRNNEDEELKPRRLLGLELLSSFHEESEAKFVDGRIYNPEDGQTYTCELTLEGDNDLKVYGYVDVLGIVPVGKTQIWKRVSQSTEKTTEKTKGKEDEDE